MSALASYVQRLIYRNTQLRLQNMQLTADLNAQIAAVERWAQIARDSQTLAANWETTALAAIAKAELMEKRQ